MKITIEQFAQLLSSYQISFDKSVSAVRDGSNANKVQYDEYWAGLIRDNLNELEFVTSRILGPNNENLIKNGGVVDDGLAAGMDKAGFDLRQKSYEVQDYFKNYNVGKAIIFSVKYWTGYDLNEYLNVAAKVYLEKFKETKDGVEKGRQEIKYWNNISDKTEKEMELYNNLVSSVENAQGLINTVEAVVGEDNLNTLYKKYGMGKPLTASAITIINEGAKKNPALTIIVVGVIVIVAAAIAYYVVHSLTADSKAAREAHRRIDERVANDIARITNDYMAPIAAANAQGDMALVKSLQDERDAKIQNIENKGEEDKQKIPKSGPDIGTVILWGGGIVGSALVVGGILKYLSERQRTKQITSAITRTNPGAAKRTYTTTGAQAGYTKSEIDTAIKNSQGQWMPFDIKASLPFSQGEAIKQVIKTTGIPVTKIKNIFYHGGIKQDGYGFYGLDVTYKNGQAQIYIADSGDSVQVVASDFLPFSTALMKTNPGVSKKVEFVKMDHNAITNKYGEFWVYHIYYGGRKSPGVISGYFKTKSDAAKAVKNYLETGKFRYLEGPAELN